MSANKTLKHTAKTLEDSQDHGNTQDLGNAQDSGKCTLSWGIAEMAAHFEITTRAIRFYEDKGLISPDRIRGSRIFSPTDRQRLEKILRAKRLGFSLEDIREVMEVTDGLVTERAELLHRKENFKKVVKSLHRRRRDIDVLARDLLSLCAIIEDYEQNAPDTGVFQFAGDYEAKFREYLDEDFLPL
ncbi:MAG: hypothetical protein COA43_07380 [Robiginitomaculum sp.]|nr:MAG: hypothetical protein COA43_07380 [Robiginitomaculum sp.]